MTKWIGHAAAVAGLLAAGHAMAGDKLIYAPEPAWIKPVETPKADPAQASAPSQLLKQSVQIDFNPDGDTFFNEVAIHVQTPVGLQQVTPFIVWNPETETATVHKVLILRGDQTIDLLAKGQTFTVVRRETNMERSMLDGELTGVLQPEGLEVGDTLVYSMSVTRKDPVMGGRSEMLLGNNATVPIGRISYRAQWEGNKPIRLRQSDDLPAGKLTKRPDGGEFVSVIDHAKRPDAPDTAPGRFQELSEMEFSQFTSWQELSSLLAPLYDKASTLTADSPLKAKAADIRAHYTGQAAQAAAALRLVENEVRYVFLGMNQGGYVPTDADVTWSRRFGDCKGKTAMLLALLRELGIPAEAAVVSTGHGDGLNDRLPMVEWFDHVIVRAEIDGKTYWLDGTRYGDQDLASLAVPPYFWALPLTRAGAPLEALKPKPLDKPAYDMFMRIDASAGLDVPATVHAVRIYRGDDASALKMVVDAIPAGERDKRLRDGWQSDYSFITPRKTSAEFDMATGEMRLTMDGDADMEWYQDDKTRTWRYETDESRLGWSSPVDRSTGTHRDAPVSIAYPLYNRWVEEIVLPKGGKGFTIDGDPVDKVIGGAEFKRSMAIKDGVLTVQSSKRSLVPEIPYAQAQKETPELVAMAKKPVLLVAPQSYKKSTETAKLPGDTTKSPSDLAQEGWQLYQQKQYDQAQGRFNQALNLDPANVQALLGRANVFIFGRNNPDAAVPDLLQAVKIDPTSWQAYNTLGAAYARQKKQGDAITAYTQALSIYPNDTYALSNRAEIYAYGDSKQRDAAKGKADAETLLALDPANVMGVRILSGLAVRENKLDEAKDIVRKAIVVNPDSPELHLYLADLLNYCDGMTKEACVAAQAESVEEYGSLIALKPTVSAYLKRARMRPSADRELKLQDIEDAIKLDPKDTAPYFYRASLFKIDKAYDKALADYDTAATLAPKDPYVLDRRADLHFTMGKPDLAAADLDAELALKPDDAEILNNVCWSRATHNIELAKALDECNAAIKLAPEESAFLDSRGFVELRQGKLDAALADYNASLKLVPTQSSSLYGRAIVYARQGKKTESQADLDAARKIDGRIDETWKKYGVQP
jgi:tetratricopeptide (TPR) repeat protein